MERLLQRRYPGEDKVALVRQLFNFGLPILEDQNLNAQNSISHYSCDSVKKFPGLRKTISNEVLEPLIGDYTGYTVTRAFIAKSKLREGFLRTPRNTIANIARGFPDIHLLPQAFIRALIC
jgi:hypothetical protein